MRCSRLLLLHLLFKPEAFRPVFISAVRIVRGLVVSVEVFDNVESAFVDIEMDVPFLETRRYQFPHLCFGIHAFNLFPNGIPKSTAVAIRIDVEQVHFVAMGFLIDGQHNAADSPGNPRPQRQPTHS